MASPRLTGKRVLLTGGSSGVGLAATRILADEGARMVVLARRADELRERLAEQDIAADVIHVDLADRDRVEAAVEEAVATLGGLDILVSNAGAAVFGHFQEVHPDDFDRTLDVTFKGAVDVIRAGLPHLRETRGTIVATGSLMTRVPLPTWSSYAAAKHALRGFLNTLAIEEREQNSGVRIAMVHPGPIDTPLFAQASSSTGHKPRIPPDAYRAEVVAQALVEMAVRPRREVVLGGFTLSVDLLYAHARPVADAVLLMIDRWYRSGTEQAPAPGSLWSVDNLPPVISGKIPARDSFLAPLQLGRRMPFARDTPLRLASNLVKAAAKGAQMPRALLRVVPEQPAPARPQRTAAEDPGPRPATVHV
ncbi:MAG: family NAD(P)-dependent oxidoreductase [Solirubrobacterales bacterium]|nr:family NAD(P)-dependent oxidoreductase [Solirubrobacterales bacterium]